jgi:hypothetical protein
MSLLGNNVYANPNTPLWGGGGGGVGTTIPYGTPLTFNGPSSNNPTLLEMDADAVLGVVDASANFGSFQTGDLRVYGAGEGVGSFINFGTGFGSGLGIRAVYNDGTLQANYAEFTSGGWDLSNVQTINGSNYPPGGGGSYPRDASFNSVTVNPSSTAPVAMELGAIGSNIGLYGLDEDGNPGAEFISFSASQMDLSNVTSINGVPYFNSPGTQFDFRSYPGGVPLVEAPDWGVLNAISFTPPVDGKVYVESLGTYVALVSGGGVSMTFAVDGTNISETPTTFNAYAGNTNLFGTSMFQFAVSANVTYDISSIAHCSAIPPADPDVVVTSSRMFLLFSPN